MFSPYFCIKCFHAKRSQPLRYDFAFMSWICALHGVMLTDEFIYSNLSRATVG